MKKRLALLIPILLVLFLLAGCGPKPYMPGKEEVKPTMKVLVFYPGTEFLTGEEHEVPKSLNVPKAALEELIRGKSERGGKSFIPKKAKVLDLRIENGVATVNFSREILNARVNAKREELGVAAIVRTLTEFKEIEKVRILVEGRETGKVGDKLIEDWWGNGLIKKQPFEMK